MLLYSHSILGPIVRIGPNVLSINTIAGLKEIYSSRNTNVQKSDWYRTIDALSGAFSTHSEIDVHKHAFRRRVLDHAFSDSALRSAEQFIHDNVSIWLKYLGNEAKQGEWTAAKNMGHWCSYLGYDIMGDLTYGRRFNCIESEEHRHVTQMMLDSTKLVYVVSWKPIQFIASLTTLVLMQLIPFQLGFLPCIKAVRPLLGTRLMDLLAGHLSRNNVKYVEYANAMMARRIAAEKEKDPSSSQTRKDFMHYLINAKDPQTGKGFTTTELNADSSLMISAGSDTTAITLSAVLFYLLHYPSALEKLTTDVRAMFSSVGQINGKSLKPLVFLRACINESLRMSPPVPSHLPREVLPGGLTIDGHYIPPGTIVGTAAYAIHHNPEYYPDQFKFRPERWIVNEQVGGISSPEAVTTAHAAFCPFSLGRRGCIGKNVACLELEIAVAKLLYTYDVRLPEDEKAREPSGGGVLDHENAARRRCEEYQVEDYFVAVKNGPMVEFRAREDTR